MVRYFAQQKLGRVLKYAFLNQFDARVSDLVERLGVPRDNRGHSRGLRFRGPKNQMDLPCACRRAPVSSDGRRAACPARC